MDDQIIHPQFTLRPAFLDMPAFAERVVGPQRRWFLESADRGWRGLDISFADGTDSDHIDLAKPWAAAEIARLTSYEVTGWIDPEPGDPEPFWVPRLVYIEHRFTIVDTDGDVCEYTAKERRDAEEVQARLQNGSQFIRLRDYQGCDTYVNTRHVMAVRYVAERIEVPAE